MPTVRCCVCAKHVTISTKERQYLILGEEYACSRPCVLRWIGQPGDIPIDPMLDWGAVLNLQANGFRSHFEHNFARFLNEESVPFAYEPWAFSVGDGWYIPDFWLPKHTKFIETKGRWSAGQKGKMRRFREEYPSIRLLIVPWLLNSEFSDGGEEWSIL